MQTSVFFKVNCKANVKIDLSTDFCAENFPILNSRMREAKV